MAKQRLPWELQRLRRKHSTEGGLIVYGWFNRLIGWLPARGWEAVRVTVDGTTEDILDEKRRGPLFLALRDGRHHVEFNGTEGGLFSADINVQRNHVLVDFKPAKKLPWLGATEPRWRVITLGPISSVDS